MTSRLAVCMGGRVSEEIIFGRTRSPPAPNPTSSRRPILRAPWVTRWGFSDELGTVMYGDNQQEVFLGYSMGRQTTISEATAQKIDSEVRRLVEMGLGEARRIITERRNDLETLARGCSNSRP
ncbi:hypothetical protein RZS28_00735 [Methylocapsa polymorpha]|uniref:Peptidase M41 domain-containing protein n=1 Tax=Methylocapsa polymorpha TaxID=3080828 RepID=A0ABZ0HRE5_9HYPH|nr:hypothetical protein RZS28_00735 [Methylocapsa sp. RX1]